MRTEDAETNSGDSSFEACHEKNREQVMQLMEEMRSREACVLVYMF